VTQRRLHKLHDHILPVLPTSFLYISDIFLGFVAGARAVGAVAGARIGAGGGMLLTMVFCV
jgi:hypothetical protein